MSGKRIVDADGLFRAATAGDYRVLAHYLSTETGEILSRAVAHDPRGAPLEAPKLGDYAPSENAGETDGKPDPVAEFRARKLKEKKPLFTDDGSREASFQGGFWERAKKEVRNPLGEGAVETAAERQRLARLFADDAEKPKTANPFGDDEGAARAADAAAPPGDAAGETSSEYLHRVPVAEPELWRKWRLRFTEREVGDPDIRDRLRRALARDNAEEEFAELMRRYPRTEEQWLRYVRKQTLIAAGEWLKTLPPGEWAFSDEEAPV